MAPPSPNYLNHQREDGSALDRFNVHGCPTRRIFSGTRLELMTRQAKIQYLHLWAAATLKRLKVSEYVRNRDFKKAHQWIIFMIFSVT
ncbi:hypothetical protein TNCV_5052901 [Trichonephila clavipes]|nr:hypothetical protein TNCV_5052901 [Trichonephila clavipes]